METTFYQARSGRIYMKCEWVDFKYNRHSCETDLIEPQVTSLLPAIAEYIDFGNKEQFDLNEYQNAYGKIAAEMLYTTLSMTYGIKPESFIKQRIDSFKASAQSLADSTSAANIKLIDLNLSSRAFNILYRQLLAYNGDTAEDALINIPSLASIHKCGIKSITEIINAFYKAGIPCKHWINEVREDPYFIKNFIGELEEES